VSDHERGPRAQPHAAESTSFDVSLESLVGGDTIVDNLSVADAGHGPESDGELPVARRRTTSLNDGPLGVGDVVAGKYAVERVLGRGGMGQIVAAKHMELGTMVAVKIVLPEALGSEATVGRFKREALAMASLRSEHAVRIIDVGDLEGMPYLIMEYLEGADLAAELRRRGALPVKEAVTYALEAMDVLAEAHDIGIVHRDLKPGNLFLAWRPSKTRSVRVLDFGIAKPMVGAALAEDVEPSRESNQDSVEIARPRPSPRRARGAGRLTMAGMTLGTPNFMAPEQVSSGQIGPHTDVWGLGATLYTLLTGALPFTGPSLSLICGAVCTLPPIPPRQHRPEIPVAVEAVILRCLNKLPAKRFMSIRELAAALEHASNVRAPSTTMGLRAPRPRADDDDDDDDEHERPADHDAEEDEERDEDDGADLERVGESTGALHVASPGPSGDGAALPPALATHRTFGDVRAGATVQVRAMWDRGPDPMRIVLGAAVAVAVLASLAALFASSGNRARADANSIAAASQRTAAAARGIAAAARATPKR
jgi:serine/threonine-protein kinase